MSEFIPKNLTLSANQVRLEPLSLVHESALREAVCDGEMWRLVFTTAPKPDCVADYIQAALNSRFAFAVIDEITGKCIGTTSFYNVKPEIPRVEIGYTWYSQSAQRSRINTTCKFLLLQYAFEILNCHVVSWETDIINHRSQAAIERLGAKKDGVIRGDRVRKDGTIRDSVFYSMLRDEWADAKANLLKKLAK